MKVTVTCCNELSPNLGKTYVKFQFGKGPLGRLLRPKSSHYHKPNVQSSRNLAQGSSNPCRCTNLRNLQTLFDFCLSKYQGKEVFCLVTQLLLTNLIIIIAIANISYFFLRTLGKTCLALFMTVCSASDKVIISQNLDLFAYFFGSTFSVTLTI